MTFIFLLTISIFLQEIFLPFWVIRWFIKPSFRINESLFCLIHYAVHAIWDGFLRNSCFSSESNLSWFRVSQLSTVQCPLDSYWEYKLEGLSPGEAVLRLSSRLWLVCTSVCLQPLQEVWRCLCKSWLPLPRKWGRPIVKLLFTIPSNPKFPSVLQSPLRITRT